MVGNRLLAIKLYHKGDYHLSWTLQTLLQAFSGNETVLFLKNFKILSFSACALFLLSQVGVLYTSIKDGSGKKFKDLIFVSFLLLLYAFLYYHLKSTEYYPARTLTIVSGMLLPWYSVSLLLLVLLGKKKSLPILFSFACFFCWFFLQVIVFSRSTQNHFHRVS